MFYTVEKLMKLKSNNERTHSVFIEITPQVHEL